MKVRQPWLTKNNRPLSEGRLKRSSRSWSQKTWNAYLDWYEGQRSESLIQPKRFDELAEQMEHSIFEFSSSSACDELKEQARRLMTGLTPRQSMVIKLNVWDSLSVRRTAQILNIHHKSVQKLKNRAIEKLRRLHQTAAISRIIEGPNSFGSENDLSIWQERRAVISPIAGGHNADNWKAEIENMPSDIKRALLRFDQDQQQIIFWRNWCGLSITKISQKLNLGVNVVDTIHDSTRFKLMTILAHEQAMKRNVRKLLGLQETEESVTNGE